MIGTILRGIVGAILLFGLLAVGLYLASWLIVIVLIVVAGFAIYRLFCRLTGRQSGTTYTYSTTTYTNGTERQDATAYAEQLFDSADQDVFEGEELFQDVPEVLDVEYHSVDDPR